jgi:hypothetical protein
MRRYAACIETAASHHYADSRQLAMIEAKKNIDVLNSSSVLRSIYAGVAVLFQSIFTATSIVHR